MIRASIIALCMATPAMGSTLLEPISILECKPAHIQSGLVIVKGEPGNWSAYVEDICVWEGAEFPWHLLPKDEGSLYAKVPFEEEPFPITSIPEQPVGQFVPSGGSRGQQRAYPPTPGPTELLPPITCWTCNWYPTPITPHPPEIAPVPILASVWLLLTGLGSISLLRRKCDEYRGGL